jgi:hypothetical protein
MRAALVVVGACSSPAHHSTGALELAPAAGWTGVPCEDGLRFSADGTAAYACTTELGFFAGTASGGAIAWRAANSGIDNLAGAALATHPISPAQLAYVAQPSAADVWFRSGDTAMTWAPVALTKTYPPFAVRMVPMVGNMMGTWDGGAVVLTGFLGTPAPHAVATATGEVRALAATSSTDIYAAVLGATPDGGTATGGVFHSTDGAMSWTEVDAGIGEPQLVTFVAIDPDDPTSVFATLRGGGQIYHSTDGAQTWQHANAGLPAGADVVMIAFTPTALYAATSAGLYLSSDAGASWQLGALDGTPVRAVAAAGSSLLVGANDAIGLYSRL